MADVLIVDDDSSMCELLALVVKRQGHGAAVALTLAEGIKKASEKDFDVLFGGYPGASLRSILFDDHDLRKQRLQCLFHPPLQRRHHLHFACAAFLAGGAEDAPTQEDAKTCVIKELG